MLSPGSYTVRRIQSGSIKNNKKNVRFVAMNEENVLKGHLFILKPSFVIEQPEQKKI